ncbi:MAG: YqgE/AlgH family protein [Acidimicrobiales bacterium]
MADTRGGLQGRLLVAGPRLVDPNFARSVVLLLAHGDQGAVGLVLNRPSTTSVASPLPEWEGLASEPAVVFVGGPVSEGSICLARVKPQVSVPGSGYLPLQGALGTVDLEADPAFVQPCIERLRVFAGYAGWGASQLEDEIGSGAWWLLEAGADDAFSDDPAALWKRVLRRQGGQLALVSAFPAEPSLN